MHSWPAIQQYRPLEEFACSQRIAGICVAFSIVQLAKWVLFWNFELSAHDYHVLAYLEGIFCIACWEIYRAITNGRSIYEARLIVSLGVFFVFYVKAVYIVANQTIIYSALTFSAIAWLTFFWFALFRTYEWTLRRLLRAQQRSVSAPVRFSRLDIGFFWFLWACALVGTLMYAESQLGGLGSLLFEQTYLDRTIVTTEMGYLDLVVWGLIPAVFFIPLILVRHYLREQDKRRVALLIVVVVVMIPISLLFLSNRRNPLGILFGLLVIFVPSLSLKGRMAYVAAALLAPFALAGWALIRSLPLVDVDLTVLEERLQSVTWLMFESTELSILDEYLKIFRDFGDSLSSRWGVDYIKMLTVLVPREIMESKPLASGTEFIRIYYPEWFSATGGAVTVSMPGELLWNLSFAGLVMGPIFYGGLLAWFDARGLYGRSEVWQALFLVAAFSLYFGIVRGGHHLILLEIMSHAWPIALVVALKVLVNLSRHGSSQRPPKAGEGVPLP